jgi:hypothetical protein
MSHIDVTSLAQRNTGMLGVEATVLPVNLR